MSSASNKYDPLLEASSNHAVDYTSSRPPRKEQGIKIQVGGGASANTTEKKDEDDEMDGDIDFNPLF